MKPKPAYRSITVMTGQVRAPAVAALTTSTPSRAPNRLVFHFLSRDGMGRAASGDRVRDMIAAIWELQTR